MYADKRTRHCEGRRYERADTVDQYFFPDKSAGRTTQRRQPDAMLDSKKGMPS